MKPASERTSIIITCNDSHLPVDNRNLAYRAADAYLPYINKPFHVKIDLYKHIPTEAGLGGGSSDATAVLRALNTYFNQAVDRSALTLMAARLSSDVPLFLAEKTVRVIVPPVTGVSTARAYALLDAMPNRQPGTSTERLLSHLRHKKQTSMNVSELLAMGLSNDFESVVLVAYPDVARAYEMIVSAGALRALLCGSGSAIFGLARDLQHANDHNMTSKQTRVGMGLDAHRFLPTQNGSSNKIMLCGVEVPATFDIEANSDGDVGLHALVDALLGSVAAGDIGMHFAPDDKQWAGANRNMTSKQTRVGMGLDAHRFLPTQNGSSNKIMLCGVEVPSTFNIEANSDGDVGLHALVDALLGSVAAGDIGMHFDPNDKQWAGAKSSIFLKHALMIVHEKGGELVNIDITIIAEKPCITPYRQIMREKLSELLALDIERVSVKVTTTEKMGFIGREEGIAAQAIVSVLV
ncbi:unnamed protein product [Rotaria sordida]|uniref:2-C-methyl-D-erythritol 2,4-cyclodiphosphate synthase n=2 Tax=Rotaria sordida TaxID=392033 RepID=A0A814C2P0_9BILA|nr:unnamed protein product [Rotaria sordida]